VPKQSLRHAGAHAVNINPVFNRVINQISL
jgi:hypothetical protein